MNRPISIKSSESSRMNIFHTNLNLFQPILTEKLLIFFINMPNDEAGWHQQQFINITYSTKISFQLNNVWRFLLHVKTVLIHPQASSRIHNKDCLVCAITLSAFSLSHSLVDLLVYKELLFCWKVHFQLKFRQTVWYILKHSLIRCGIHDWISWAAQTLRQQRNHYTVTFSLPSFWGWSSSPEKRCLITIKHMITVAKQIYLCLSLQSISFQKACSLLVDPLV